MPGWFAGFVVVSPRQRGPWQAGPVIEPASPESGDQAQFPDASKYSAWRDAILFSFTANGPRLAR